MSMADNLALVWAMKQAGDRGEELAKKYGIRKYLGVMILLHAVLIGVIVYLKFFYW